MSYEELWSGVNSNGGRIFERWVTRVNSDMIGEYMYVMMHKSPKMKSQWQD